MSKHIIHTVIDPSVPGLFRGGKHAFLHTTNTRHFLPSHPLPYCPSTTRHISCICPVRFIHMAFIHSWLPSKLPYFLSACLPPFLLPFIFPRTTLHVSPVPALPDPSKQRPRPPQWRCWRGSGCSCTPPQGPPPPPETPASAFNRRRAYHKISTTR